MAHLVKFVEDIGPIVSFYVTSSLDFSILDVLPSCQALHVDNQCSISWVFHFSKPVIPLFLLFPGECRVLSEFGRF